MYPDPAMSSILDNRALREAVLPISVQQYHQLGEAGIIDARTELLWGFIVTKMIKSPDHTWIVQHLVHSLRPHLPAGWHLRQEQPLTFTDSEPEPDVAVVAGTPDDYRVAHPSTAILVIEVDVSSAALDRQKAQLYATAGVLEYLIVLPAERSVEVYREPSCQGYARRDTFGSDAGIELLSLAGLVLDVSPLFH